MHFLVLQRIIDHFFRVHNALNDNDFFLIWRYQKETYRTTHLFIERLLHIYIK